MKSYKSRFLLSCIAGVLSLVVYSPALRAQSQSSTSSNTKADSPSPSDDGWHVGVVPYLWFAGVHGTVGALGHEASVHASFADVISNFNLGFMGSLDTRYNRILLPTDFMWIKLSDDQSLPFDEGASSVKAKMTQTIFSQYVGYRFVDQKKFQADALFGFRYWHLTNDLTLQPTELKQGFSASADWVDGVAGARFTAWLSPKMMVRVLGDAGGGTAKSDYQVAGILGFKVSKKWILGAGYRYMNVNYRQRTGLFIYDVAQSGLILGATWNVK